MNTGKSSAILRARSEVVLMIFLVAEFVFFSAFGRNFLTADNLSNIVRHSTEIGLLALVMMPIILTGGIDLSVGSLLGLCAVLLAVRYIKSVVCIPM